MFISFIKLFLHVVSFTVSVFYFNVFHIKGPKSPALIGTFGSPSVDHKCQHAFSLVVIAIVTGSPPWHRHLRKRRSEARSRLRRAASGRLGPRALEDVVLLERHHSRPQYRKIRRVMSWQGGGWRGGYWQGARRSPKQAKPAVAKKKAEREQRDRPKDAMPGYDSEAWSTSLPSSSSAKPTSSPEPSVSALTKLLRSIVETGQLEVPEEAKSLLMAQDTADSKEELQKEQKKLNARRKIHGKILRLKEALERKQERFKVYKAALREQLAKETERFEQDVDGIKTSLREAEETLGRMDKGDYEDPANARMEEEEPEIDSLLDTEDAKERARLQAQLLATEKEKKEMESQFETMKSQMMTMQMQYQSAMEYLHGPQGSQRHAWTISPVASEDLSAGVGTSPQHPSTPNTSKPPVRPFSRSSTPRLRDGPYTEKKGPCGLEVESLSKLE